MSPLPPRLATRPWEFCRALVEDVGARPAGSDGERRAGRYAQEVLGTMGYTVHVDEHRVPRDPAWGARRLLLGVSASALLGLVAPAPAAALAALLAGLALAEALGFPVLSRLGARVPTRNVWARMPGRGPVARTVVLVARLDSPRALPRWLPEDPRALRALAVLVALAALAVPVLLLAADAAASPALQAAALAPGALVAAAALSLRGLARGKPLVGANDAAAVAAALAAAGEHAASPLAESHLEVLLVGGGEHGPAAMARFLGEYGRHYIRERTYFLEIASVGRGAYHALAAEGLLAPVANEPDLVAAVLEAAEAEGVRASVGAVALPGNAHWARVRGWRAASLVGLERGRIPDHRREGDVVANVDPLQVEEAARLVVAVTRALDRAADPQTTRVTA